jgi:hypothetical protein
MCTGAEIPAILAAAGTGEAAAASAPLIGAEIGAGGDLSAGLGGSSALAGSAGPGLLSEGLGAGAAGELGATSSGIGAAGGPANQLSLGLGNMQSMLSPYTARLGQGMRAYQGANAAMGALGGGQRPAPPAGAAARPFNAPVAPITASQIFNRGTGLGSPFSSAGMVGGAMGQGGGMPPGLMQLLARLQSMQGGQ